MQSFSVLRGFQLDQKRNASHLQSFNVGPLQEVVYLISEDIADVEDVDAVISNGPGLRLALLGPHMNYHLGGVQGGITI